MHGDSPRCGHADLRDGYLSSFQLHFLPVTLIALLHPVESMLL